MKIHRFGCLIFVLCFLCNFVFAQEDWMPDPELRKLVYEKLQVPLDIALVRQDMLRLYDLVIYTPNNIENLKGLEHAVNLTFLHIGAGKVSDLTPLASLKRLEVLKLHDNRIVDISPLSSLRNLRTLNLSNNQIRDFTPLLGHTQLEVLKVDRNPGDASVLLKLNIATFSVCDIEGLPVAPRVLDRAYPSVFGAWMNIINLPLLTEFERLAHHDLYFCCPMFGLTFVETEGSVRLVGDIRKATEECNEIRSANPNIVLLVGVRYFSGFQADDFPEDWSGWLRDKGGNRITESGWNETLVDFTESEVQEWVIEQAVAVSQCGLFDGIFLDHWNEHPRLKGYRSLEEEHAARDKILEGIRSRVDEDFLIMVNTNRHKIPRWASYVNGTFMETLPGISTGLNHFQGRGYTDVDLHQIESTLLWSEAHMRQPRINGLEGWGLIEEPPDSSRNQQWMRLFTTLSLTHSDGYVLYTIGSGSLEHEHPWENEFLNLTWGHVNQAPHVHDHDHYWYNFWDADLGKPVGEKAKRYRDREGLFIREFTNGWAVYNRSGSQQRIQLPELVSAVASGVENKRWHTLPDLDGEIYLKPIIQTTDVNGDGAVNILDIVVVANAFGEDKPDLNNDGIVNILDLIKVSAELNQ